jgi:hypothetical protein
MATKLEVYNLALGLMGNRPLVSDTEVNEFRYLLDTQYDADAVDACLEVGLWDFAKRVVQIEYDSGTTPDFGLRRAFVKPTDFIRTWAASGDEYFNQPLTGEQISSDPGFWFADIDRIWVTYVSNDASYGGDLSAWPPSFTRTVAAFLAMKVMPAKSASDIRSVAAAQLEFNHQSSDARSKAAQNQGTKFPPQGTWTRSRFSGSRQRGSRTRLTG